VITKLNLASQPFRNRTLPWTVTAIVAAASIVALFFFVAESRRTTVQADKVERDLQALRQERDALETQFTQVRQSVPPDQLETLEAAHLLVDRKRFSWSKLFADLEAALPGSVRVSRISVRDVAQRGGQTRAELELTVVGRAPADVIGMITEMNRAGVFFVTPKTESPREGKSDGGIEWALGVNYVQRTIGSTPDSGADNGGANVASSATPAASTSEAQ